MPQKPSYEKCLDLILDYKPSSLINIQDKYGATPLYYANLFQNQNTVTKLLLKGANVALKNVHGAAPISKIPPSTIESFLNEHCIKKEGDPNDENFKLTFNYRFLAPVDR